MSGKSVLSPPHCTPFKSLVPLGYRIDTPRPLHQNRSCSLLAYVQEGGTMGCNFPTIILLSVLVSTLLIDQSYARQLEGESSSSADDSLKTGTRSFYVTPYLGGSTLVGNFGIEFQYKRYGYNIGILKSTDVVAIDNILCGGIKYYFEPYHHSWAIGVGGGVVLDELKPDDNLCGEWSGDIPDDWVCDTGIVIDKYVGILIGYRWIWWDELRLNIGAGPNYIKWKQIREGDKHKYLPMFELVIGYSF